MTAQRDVQTIKQALCLSRIRGGPHAGDEVEDLLCIGNFVFPDRRDVRRRILSFAQRERQRRPDAIGVDALTP